MNCTNLKYSLYIYFMIYYSTPYNSDKNIGKYYNQFMKLLPNDNDFVCFVDGDAMFTTHFFGTQIEDITKKYPDCGLFTAMTNRVGTKYQCVPNMWDNNDMQDHWTIGKNLYNHYYDDTINITKSPPLSGFLILLRKKEWKHAGGFLEDKMLGIDNSIHYRVRDFGGQVKLMTGVYLMHYYRGGDMANKEHLL